MDKTARILIAEDEKGDAALIKIVLDELGLGDAVAVVHDGVEALDYLLRRGPCATRPQGNPDLLFLDLKLPKVNGLEVLRQIRAQEELKGMRVVVFSSSVDEKDRTASLACGADEYAVKPIDFDQFQAAITGIVNAYVVG
jgi:two-component system, response regulator